MDTEDNTQLECDQLKEFIAIAEARLKEINDARESMVRTIAISGGWVMAILSLISGRVIAAPEIIQKNVTNFTIFTASSGCLLMSIVMIYFVHQGLKIPSSPKWMGQKKIFEEALSLLKQNPVLTEIERLKKRQEIYELVIANDTELLEELREFYRKLIMSFFMVMPIVYFSIVIGSIVFPYIHHP